MALTKGQKSAAEKNRLYWEQRELEQKKHYITDEKEYSKHLNKIYEDMLDNVQKEIEAFYGKYAKAEGITIAEAKKRVSQLDIEAYERKAKRYVEDKDFSKEANEEMRLYNATMKINRLEMLKANIGLELISGHEELQKYMESILQGRTEEELKRQAGILGETIKDNAKAAHAIVNASFHNAKYSDRIWMHQDILKAELSKQLQSGLIQGKNPRVLAKNIRQKFDVSKASAETLMRTELARVQTEAQKLSFERNGFEQYTFLALGDACGICKELNDKHFYVKDMMPGTNAPPMHPNCRCSTSAYEDSEEYDKWLEHLEKGGTTEEWNEMQNKGILKKDTKSGKMKEREMASGARKSYHIPLSEEDKQFILNEIDAIGADRNSFEFRDFQPTAYSDSRNKIYISSSVFPSTDGSLHPTDMLSVRATLAHEYYGHKSYRNTPLEKGSWNDEFRASYMAAKHCPGLTNEDRTMLINDAMQRARDAGVNIKSNAFIRRCLYGIE